MKKTLLLIFSSAFAALALPALVENGAHLDIRVVTGSAGGGAVLPHEGALAFARGEPLEVVQ